MRLVLSTWKSLGTWYADTQNKTRGKYFPVRSAAAIPAADGLVLGVCRDIGSDFGSKPFKRTLWPASPVLPHFGL